MTENKKKILILYASAGSGHKKAAEAIFHSLPKDQYEATLSDIGDFMPSFFSKVYSDGYLFLISHFQWMWGFFYFLSDTKWLSLINVNFRKFSDNMMCHSLIKHLCDKKYDCVISCHFLASAIVATAKEKYNCQTRLITVVTDFGVHNFWINSKTDIYCCASEATKNTLIQKGIDPQTIRVTGIPLDKKFREVQGRAVLEAELGLEKGMFTCLLATGGIGAGPIEEIVESLKGNVQLLVVCGKNKKLFNKLKEKNYPHVHCFEFVDYMQKLMRVSDCIVTKAGGLTVTECLSMALPMIFFFIIPGQEMHNARMIEDANAGLIADSVSEIKEFVVQWKNVPEDLEIFKAKALALAKPNSSSDIVSLI